jgi:hypothetical protein
MGKRMSSIISGLTPWGPEAQSVTVPIVDERKKLQAGDYTIIYFQYNVGHTIRAISNEFGISTKYVKKILESDPGGRINWRGTESFSLYPNDCSGCGRHFDLSGLMAHFYTFTSGGLTDLICGTMLPG